MENVINQILRIDHEANDRLERAKEESTRILAEAKLEEARIKREHVEHADSRISKVDAFEKMIADEKITALENDRQIRLNQLQAKYDASHEMWEKEIFERIVGE